MHNDSQLSVSSELFKSGGVLGRLDYFLNLLKLSGFTILACIPIVIGSVMFGESGQTIGTVVAAIGGLPIFLAYYPILDLYDNFITFFNTRNKQ